MLREVENDELIVDFEVTDESFDHAFGRKKQSGYEINRVQVYIPAMSDWMDLTHTGEEKIWDAARKLVEANLELEF